MTEFCHASATPPASYISSFFDFEPGIEYFVHFA